jgi:hypothetical protein
MAQRTSLSAHAVVLRGLEQLFPAGQHGIIEP